MSSAAVLRGIGAGELFLDYQPQVVLRTGEVSGAEALIRWNHPVRGVLLPGQFLPFVEPAVFVQLTEWILDRSIGQLRCWRRGGHALRLSVNVSGASIQNHRFPVLLRSLLQKHEVEPGSLTLEITEDGMLDGARSTVDVLDAISEMGVGISIDDFGTGYSSLSHLRDFPIGEVKIDRSFVAAATCSSRNRQIVQAVVRLANDLDLEVVAEGVEDEETRQALLDMDCGKAQGFHFFHPMPPETLGKYLASA